MDGWPLVWVLVGLATAAVTVRWSRLVWARRKELPGKVQPLAPVVAGMGLLGSLVAMVGVIRTFGALGGESMDPSQKARIMVEDAAGGVSWTVAGILLCAASAVARAWLLRQSGDRPS